MRIKQNMMILVLVLVPLVLMAEGDRVVTEAFPVGTSGTGVSQSCSAEYVPGAVNDSPDQAGGSRWEIWQRLYDTKNYAMLAENRVSQRLTGFNPETSYSKLLSGTGGYGHCFRGAITATGFNIFGHQTATNISTSAESCIDAPPMPVDWDRDCHSGGDIPGEAHRSPGSKRAILDESDRCDPASPILIDVKGKKPDMGPADDPVQFDILRTGRPIWITWTKRNSDTGFLVMDRNSNGMIDDGGELFGNHTDTAYGEPPVLYGHGFAALCEYDNKDLGGDLNGRVDAGDAVWSRLRLWIDRNHDGVSQARELYTLDSLGITGIDRDFDAEHPHADKEGNVYRFKGTAYRIAKDGRGRNGRDREEAFEIYDVVFKKVQ